MTRNDLIELFEGKGLIVSNSDEKKTTWVCSGWPLAICAEPADGMVSVDMIFAGPVAPFDMGTLEERLDAAISFVREKLTVALDVLPGPSSIPASIPEAMSVDSSAGYSIENIGYDETMDHWALFFGRSPTSHGLNLCRVSDFDFRGQQTRQLITRALNRLVEFEARAVAPPIPFELVCLSTFPQETWIGRPVFHPVQQNGRGGDGGSCDWSQYDVGVVTEVFYDDVLEIWRCRFMEGVLGCVGTLQYAADNLWTPKAKGG